MTRDRYTHGKGLRLRDTTAANERGPPDIEEINSKTREGKPPAASRPAHEEENKMASELLGTEATKTVTWTLRLKTSANDYDASREASKLARELGIPWRPEEAVARWLRQQVIEALKELRAEKARREADSKTDGNAAQRTSAKPKSEAE